MRIASAASAFARAALDLVAPARCAGCGAEVAEPLCVGCALDLRAGGPLARVLVTADGALPVFAATCYEGSARASLLAYKERGRRDVGVHLAHALSRAAIAAAGGGFLTSSTILVCVPSSPVAVRDRGYDAVSVLTRLAARELRRGGLDVGAMPALQHIRTVADQAGLSVAGRRSNLVGAMAVGRPRDAARLRGRAVVVADDIVTSGATATEAARALARVGTTVTAVIAVAGTLRRSAEPTVPIRARPG